MVAIDKTYRLLINATPPELRMTRQSLRDVHRNRYAIDPDFYLKPMSTHEVAELLGISTNALKQMRYRGEGPPGYVKLQGMRACYRSRLEVYEFLHDCKIAPHPQDA